MSSVLYQSLNSAGSPALRNELNRLSTQLADTKKDVSLLLKVLEQKVPEVVEEFSRMKAQDSANAVLTNSTRPPSNNSVNTLRR